MKAYGGRADITPLILNLSARQRRAVMFISGLIYSSERACYPNLGGECVGPRPVWAFSNNVGPLPPSGLELPYLRSAAHGKPTAGPCPSSDTTNKETRISIIQLCISTCANQNGPVWVENGTSITLSSSYQCSNVTVWGKQCHCTFCVT